MSGQYTGTSLHVLTCADYRWHHWVVLYSTKDSFHSHFTCICYVPGAAWGISGQNNTGASLLSGSYRLVTGDWWGTNEWIGWSQIIVLKMTGENDRWAMVGVKRVFWILCLGKASLGSWDFNWELLARWACTESNMKNTFSGNMYKHLIFGGSLDYLRKKVWARVWGVVLGVSDRRWGQTGGLRLQDVEPQDASPLSTHLVCTGFSVLSETSKNGLYKEAVQYLKFKECRGKP